MMVVVADAGGPGHPPPRRAVAKRRGQMIAARRGSSRAGRRCRVRRAGQPRRFLRGGDEAADPVSRPPRRSMRESRVAPRSRRSWSRSATRSSNEPCISTLPRRGPSASWVGVSSSPRDEIRATACPRRVSTTGWPLLPTCSAKRPSCLRASAIERRVGMRDHRELCALRPHTLECTHGSPVPSAKKRLVETT